MRFMAILPFVEYPDRLSLFYLGLAFCNANTRAGTELRASATKSLPGHGQR
jgi:hypothetical protein